MAAADGFLHPEPLIDRASPGDRAFLAMDSGDIPEQFGVLLVLDQARGLDVDAVRALVGERIPAVPRLRQRLSWPPFGCGGPVWVDDPAFDVRDHVRALACPAPRDERALLEAALSLIEERLPKSRPLWAAVLVTGLPDDHAGLVFVLHHVLSDGVGGLAVLAGLVDGREPPPKSGFPHPAPATSALAREAFGARLRALRNIGRSWRLLRSSLSAGGGLHPPRAVASSLNQRTGSRRLVAAVHADLSVVRAAAHAHRATVNDAVLVAVAGALHRVLAARGERWTRSSWPSRSPAGIRRAMRPSATW